MTVTYQQFAEHLLKYSHFYYKPHETVYAYVTEDGRVRYFANWGYGETRDYASLKSLMEATTGRELPDAEDLAEQQKDARPETVHHVITDAQFLERFSPVKNHLNPNAPFDGCMFETFGNEFEHVRTQDPALVWTVIDCDGTMTIESGCHFVNRLGYLVASQPRPDQSTYAVGDDDAEPDTVTVNRHRLTAILEYLQDSEADHYDPETYPDDVNNHVYAHVLAITAELDAAESAPQTSLRAALLSNDVLCELAHAVTVRECGIRGVILDAENPDDDETRYTDEAQEIFEAIHDIASTVLEPYCAKGGAR